VYLHGIQSHSGWYGASSRRLAEAGRGTSGPVRDVRMPLHAPGGVLG